MILEMPKRFGLLLPFGSLEAGGAQAANGHHEHAIGTAIGSLAHSRNQYELTKKRIDSSRKNEFGLEQMTAPKT